jgi:hypothetical protein
MKHLQLYNNDRIILDCIPVEKLSNKKLLESYVTLQFHQDDRFDTDQVEFRYREYMLEVKNELLDRMKRRVVERVNYIIK